ncbi:hypothetical protein J2X76_002216 [Neorhizobium sp. 2083]|nr:hypothetical protein [Neorhizobium sp. 2083]
MEGQFLVTQLVMLLEQRAAQHSLGWWPLAAGLSETMPAQVPRHQPEQIAMLIQPFRHLLQFTTDLVFGEKIKYAGLDGAFLAHCRFRRLRVCL